MSFGSELERYMGSIGISGRELAAASGVSEAALSRYRQGKRVPEASGDRIRDIASALYDLSVSRDVDCGSRDDILKHLLSTLPGADIDHDSFVGLLRELTLTLGITNVSLAKALNFDPSHISRIFSGRRRVNDAGDFAYKCASYVAGRYGNAEYAGTISALTGCTEAEAADPTECLGAVYNYLTAGKVRSENRIGEFLRNIDDFDLNEFSASTHFDELRVPSVPFQIHRNKTYYGIKGLMECEIDFNKATMLSKSDAPVIMYSDMPINEIAEDEEMTRKYMISLAMMIKKGLHLNVIHNIDRPMNEMIEGLKGWIPMYMTGQISPYYMTSKGSPFRHMIRASGQAAVLGTGITGDNDDNRFYLTMNREEVERISKQAESLLKKASPLMDIFNEGADSRFHSFLEKETESAGDRYWALTSPPIFTISDPLLEEILGGNDLTADEKAGIREHVRYLRTLNERGSENSRDIYLLPERYDGASYRLSVSTMFLEKDISCTYQQYMRHMEETKRYVDGHEGMMVKTVSDAPFRNIQIMVHQGKLALISKSKAPAIHYAITQPNMVRAFEQFVKTYANEL